MNSDVDVVSPRPLRSAKAAATRAGIIAAAGRLFTEQGYLGTSVQLIAAAAGVSRATVFNSVGGKAALLRAAYDVATVGDDAPVPLPQRPEALAIRAEPDPRRAIRRYAALVTGVSSRLAGIYEAFRSAAGVDPEVRAMRRRSRPSACPEPAASFRSSAPRVRTWPMMPATSSGTPSTPACTTGWSSNGAGARGASRTGSPAPWKPSSCHPPPDTIPPGPGRAHPAKNSQAPRPTPTSAFRANRPPTERADPRIVRSVRRAPGTLAGAVGEGASVVGAVPAGGNWPAATGLQPLAARASFPPRSARVSRPGCDPMGG
jgi:AcrR family transcriptional regulator